MRTSCLILLLLASTVAQSAFASTLSREDAMERVRSAGYPLVSKSEAAPGAWEVWASKDGIVYNVKVNAADGTLMASTPAESDD